jgi:hypothetical protein
MDGAVDARSGQPSTEGALGGCDHTVPPLMTDAPIPERRNEGMVRAEQVGRQLRNPQLNLAQLVLLMFSRRRVRGARCQVLLDRVQTRLDHVQAPGDLDKG